MQTASSFLMRRIKRQVSGGHYMDSWMPDTGLVTLEQVPPSLLQLGKAVLAILIPKSSGSWP